MRELQVNDILNWKDSDKYSSVRSTIGDYSIQLSLNHERILLFSLFHFCSLFENLS